MGFQSYYGFSRTLRIILILIGLIATIIACAHVDMIDVRSHDMCQLERDAQREEDRRSFHRGNDSHASVRDKERQIEAYERNCDFESCHWERNTD